MHDRLLIGVSARIYYPGADGMPLAGVWTKTLHYLEQSVAHWLLAGGAMAVMVPAVDADSVVKRSDLDLHDYAAALDTPQAHARGMVVEMYHPALGHVKTIGTPIKMSATPLDPTRRAPLLG